MGRHDCKLKSFTDPAHSRELSDAAFLQVFCPHPAQWAFTAAAEGNADVFMAQTIPQKGINPAKDWTIRLPSAVQITTIFSSRSCQEQVSYLHTASRYKHTQVPTGLGGLKPMGREPGGSVAQGDIPRRQEAKHRKDKVSGLTLCRQSCVSFWLDVPSEALGVRWADRCESWVRCKNLPKSSTAWCC